MTSQRDQFQRNLAQAGPPYELLSKQSSRREAGALPSNPRLGAGWYAPDFVVSLPGAG